MAAPAPPRPRARVFERPVHHDPLLWAGLAVGVALVVMAPPTGLGAVDAVVSVALRFLGGLATAAFFGGFVRNLVRAITGEDVPGQEDP